MNVSTEQVLTNTRCSGLLNAPLVVSAQPGKGCRIDMSKQNSPLKDWHDIKFYTVQELGTMLMAAGPTKSVENDLLRELLFCSPLVLRESLARGRKMLIGEVMEQNNPWDIVLHDEEQLRAVHGTSKPMPDPLF